MNTTNTFIKGVLTGILGVVLFSSKAVLVKLAYRCYLVLLVIT